MLISPSKQSPTSRPEGRLVYINAKPSKHATAYSPRVVAIKIDVFNSNKPPFQVKEKHQLQICRRTNPTAAIGNNLNDQKH
jgi:hypothetical protein